jgi:uncharacterized protein YbaP (TraB family)
MTPEDAVTREETKGLTRQCRDMRYAADMDREELLYHLAFAEQRAAEGLENIAKQRSVIRWLERDAQDTTKANP